MSRGQMSYHQEPQRVEMIICNEGFQFIRLLNNKGPMRLLQVASVVSVPIHLAPCWTSGLAISNATIKHIFKYNIRKQFYQTALGNCYRLKLAKC